MKIVQKDVTVGELIDGYSDKGEDGVVAYGGKLDVRPPYQREFVYNLKQQHEVINSIMLDRPLNSMYWNCDDSTQMSIIDGQQRTISICRFAAGAFSYKGRYYGNFTKEEKDQFLSYKLTVYACYGDEKDRLEWFVTLNNYGEQLNDQEVRNAVYSGPWVIDAKRYFSKSRCPAWQIGASYLSGAPIRQDYLKTVINWAANDAGMSIEDYMGNHANDPDAKELWNYFVDVIEWVERIFPTYRKEMKGIQWGILYNKYKDKSFISQEVDKEVESLYLDDDVTSKKGIYTYILTGDEKHLSIRSFSDSIKYKAYHNQNGMCAKCGEKFELKEMEADHITPWSKGGKTELENCQMLCVKCNRRKSNK
jgi:hypothetical protein